MRELQLPRPNWRCSAGASLVEILTTLCIVAVLATIVLPSLGALVSQFRARSLANAFTGSLLRARSEAIHRNGRVVVCKSNNGASCAFEGGYEQGWLVFHDANNNASLDPQETVIQVKRLPKGSIRLIGNTMVSGYVSFNGLGLPKTTAGKFQAGTWSLCGVSAEAGVSRNIVLSKPGNVRIDKDEPDVCD